MTADHDHLSRNKKFISVFKLTENTNVKINYNIMEPAYPVYLIN
jgi:hypothetical protein